MPRCSNHAMHTRTVAMPCHLKPLPCSPARQYHSCLQPRSSQCLSHLRPHYQLHPSLTKPRCHEQRRTRRRQRRAKDPDPSEVVLASKDGTSNGRSCQDTEAHTCKSHTHTCANQGAVLREGDEDGGWEGDECAGEETVCRSMGSVPLVKDVK